MLDHGVARVFLPGLASVVAVSDAFAPAGAGESHDDRRFCALLKAAGVVGIHDRAAREAPVVELPGIKRGRPFLPVHQVGADGVAPVHVAPVPAVGVVLIEEVIRTRVPDQPVGVIEPAAAGREVELGTMRLVIDQAGVGDVLGLRDAAQPRESGSSSSRSILSVLP